MYLADGDFCDDGVLAESTAPHEVVQLFTPTREPSRAVGHQSSPLGCSNLGAQVRLGATTELAVATLRRVEGNYVVPCKDNEWQSNVSIHLYNLLNPCNWITLN